MKLSVSWILDSVFTANKDIPIKSHIGHTWVRVPQTMSSAKESKLPDKILNIVLWVILVLWLRLVHQRTCITLITFSIMNLWNGSGFDWSNKDIEKYGKNV